MGQKLKILRSKKRTNPKGIWLNRNSIGTMWVSGVPFTYNADKVYSQNVTVDEIKQDQSRAKKTIILIRRK